MRVWKVFSEGTSLPTGANQCVTIYTSKAAAPTVLHLGQEGGWVCVTQRGPVWASCFFSGGCCVAPLGEVCYRGSRCSVLYQLVLALPRGHVCCAQHFFLQVKLQPWTWLHLTVLQQPNHSFVVITMQAVGTASHGYPSHG